MSKDLEQSSYNKRAPAVLITGSARRVGRAFLLSLAADGHDVALHYNHSEEAALETAEECRALGAEVVLLQHDLRDAGGLDQLMERALEALPHLGVLVNCASAYESSSILTTTVEDYDTQAMVNLRAPFFLTQAFARRVDTGQVINILDNKIGYHQYPYAAYLLPKLGLERLTYMAALELAPKIRVNAIAPGVVMPMSSRTTPYLQWRIEGIPVGHMGGTDDLYRGLRYLLDSPFVTGQVLTIDGGENTALVGRNATEFKQSSS